VKQNLVRGCVRNGRAEDLRQYGKASADTLADRFYASMQTALAERPRDYPFDDLTLAVMVRRRG
jgi:hypothetical protein